MAGRRGSADLIISGRAYLQGELKDLEICISNGRIDGVWISSPNECSKKVTVDGKKILLPGMVDMHVHMRDLRQSYKEDWLTGTRAALFGGVTAVFDMPNNDPRTDSLEVLRWKMEEASKKALVDYGFYLAVPQRFEELHRARELIFGVKLYPEDLLSDKLSDLMRELHELDLLAVIHAEISGDELMGIRRVLRSYQGGRCHFTHMSSPAGITSLLESKLSGFRVTMDTCPHYFLLSSSADPRMSVRPPLRCDDDVKLVMNSVRAGLVDAISTDHAPHTVEEKETGAPGFPGLETALPIIFTMILDGGAPLRMLDLYSSRPAEILGVNKGTLLPGRDADVVVYDYSIRRKISSEDLQTKAKFTPFEGMSVVGRVEEVYLRGKLALSKGEVLPVRGKMLRPMRIPSSSRGNKVFWSTGHN